MKLVSFVANMILEFAFCDKGSIKACVLLLPAFEKTYQIPYAILAQNRLLDLYENSGHKLR